MKLLNDIEIDFVIPQKIQKVIERIEFYTNQYEDEDEMDFMDVITLDGIRCELDITSKQVLSAGKITSKQRDIILYKYKAL